MDSDPRDKTVNPGPSTIFFSYARDDQARALPIIRLIEQAGFSVWWDGLLEGGERFSRTTEDALDRARAVVVLWSKTSAQSHWVHDEATRGRDRRVLVPLSLDGSSPPLGFGQFQVIDLSKSKMNANDVGIARMVRAIAAMHGDQSGRVLPRPVPSAPGIDRRTMIGAGSVALLAIGGYATWRAGFFGNNKIANRLAVLPFDNIGGDPSHQYVSEGLANTIRATLSQNGALQVIGQASSEVFVRGKDDAVAFAKKLGVGLLIDGAVQIVANRLSVNISVIDGSTGVSRASRTFDQSMGDILAVQREIGRAIAAELSNRIGSAGAARMLIGGTNNVVAFDHYLRGKDLYAHAGNEAEERQGVAQFDAAIATDPQFALAYAGRANALASVAASYGSATEIKAYNGAAIESARRAIDLTPRLADAHSALALILFQGQFDAKSARAPFDLSRELGDGDAPVLARFAAFCASTGRHDEALPAINRAVLLDPLNALIYRILGTVHFAAKRYPEAITAIQEALELSPNLPDTHSRIGMVLLAQNKNRDALAAFQADTHKWSKMAGVAIAQHRLGDRASAQSAMTELSNDTDTVSFYQQGQVWAQWGKPGEAMVALQRARVQRDAGLIAGRYDPMLAPLRARPDFIELLKSMGFD
ncbi:TIR domain-containing protein [Sphingorhabdus sp.]|uniref:TIR domain-containing protein n=1 Tax=Sphingorhabdus sp. TaxID=1902408 RepID=UPI003983B744